MRYRLIAGHHRLEAWKRHFGERQPIEAVIFPSHMPDARITLLDAGENAHRKDLTAAERQAGLLRYAAARKELEHGKPVTPVSDSGQGPKSGTASPSLAPARGGRGNKGMAQKIAEKLGIGKRSVNRIAKEAAAAIGEKIDLDRDTPEELERKAAELERKADKRQHAERKVVLLRRRKTEPRGVVEDATPPAEPHAGETGSKIEVVRKAFDVLASKDQFRFIHDICRSVGLEPLMMAPPAVFGLADAEPELDVELPAEVAPATDGTAEDSQPEQQDDGADVSAEDLQDAGEAELTVDLPAEVAPATHDAAVDSQAEQQDDAAHLGAESLQDADDEVSKTADQEPGGATKCAYCNIDFEDGDQLMEFDGQLTTTSALRTGRSSPRLNRASRSPSLPELASRRWGGVLGRPPFHNNTVRMLTRKACREA